jgi:hypothetical protein
LPTFQVCFKFTILFQLLPTECGIFNVDMEKNVGKKIAFFVLIGALVIGLFLGGFYILSRQKSQSLEREAQIIEQNLRNSEGSQVATTTSPSPFTIDPAEIAKDTKPFLFKSYKFPDAKVGNNYAVEVYAGVYNLNKEITVKIVSGLPPGLKPLSCSTEFNNPILIASVVNSFATCSLEGIPQQTGRYSLEFEISTSSDNVTVFKSIAFNVTSQ